MRSKIVIIFCDQYENKVLYDQPVVGKNATLGQNIQVWEQFGRHWFGLRKLINIKDHDEAYLSMGFLVSIEQVVEFK